MRASVGWPAATSASRACMSASIAWASFISRSRRGTRRSLDRTPLTYLDHALAAVFAVQEADQGGWRILQAVDDVFLDLELAGRDPVLELFQRRVALIVEVHDHETLQRQALGDDQAGDAA